MKIKCTLLNFSLLLILLVLVAGCSNEKNSDEASGDSDNENSASYPEEAIEVYVPSSAGGSSDATARLAAEYLEEELGEEIVIVNQEGGGGAQAISTVDNADPDGYTLLYQHQALDASSAMGKYDENSSDFTPLGVTGDANRVLAVSADSEWDNLEDFIEDAKDDPGELKIGVALGETTHIVAGMLSSSADIDLDIVDVGDDAELTTALLGDQVDMVVVGVDSVTDAEDDINSLAVVGNDKDDRLPDVPTAEEEGYDVVFPLTFTFWAPEGTPDEVIDKWETSLESLKENEDYVEQYEKYGMARFLTSEETAEEFQDSSKEIEAVVEELGLNEQ